MSNTDNLNNPYRDSARMRKAMTLATYLISVGIASADMSTATAQEWAMAAHLAGTNAPSLVSQAEAIRMMESMERAARTSAQDAEACFAKVARSQNTRVL